MEDKVIMSRKTVHMLIIILYISNGSSADDIPREDKLAKNKLTSYRNSTDFLHQELQQQAQRRGARTELKNKGNHESSVATILHNKDPAEIRRRELQPQQVGESRNQHIVRSPEYQQAFALGQENNIAGNQLQTTDSSGLVGLPALLTSSTSHRTSPFNTFASPSVYAQETSIPIDEQQNIVSYYVDSVDGAQQIVEIPQYTPGREHLQNSGQFASSASDLYNNPYVQVGPKRDQRIPYRMTMAQAQVPRLGTISPRPTVIDSSQHELRKDKSQKPQENNQRKNMLTNKQLMSLIDELKEFNSRQASKIQSEASTPRTGQSAPDNKESSQTDEDSKQAKRTDDETDTESESSKDESNEKKPDTDELARFAKFLMTKEGANIKFQLGLDKDSPDDGDEEDDRDALLESKKKSTKTKPKPPSKTDLDDFDRKHKEVSSQMEKLIKEVTGKKTKSTKKSNKVKSPAKASKQDDVEETEDEDTRNDRARKRRDSKVTSEHRDDSKSSNRDKKHHQSTAPKRHKRRDSEDNFAKTLIKQEMLEDQLESSQANPRSVEQETSDKGKQSIESDKPSNRPTLSNQRVKNGVKNERYSKRERNSDHAALLHELQKTRRKKAKARARLSMPGDSIVKRAMESGAGVRTERHPGGSLLLKTDDNAVLALKLPQKKLDRAKQSSRRDLSDNDDGDDDTVTSELKPTREEPAVATHNVEKVKLEGGKPIEDAYPISEKVSDRLNKLSSNLDKYFNDGFIQAIESKAELNPANRRDDIHQTEPSDRKESLQSGANLENNRVSSGRKEDQDFNVNVGVDGKQDDDRDDAEEPEDDEEDEKFEGKRRSKQSINKRKKHPKRPETTKTKRKSHRKANERRSQGNKSADGDDQVRSVQGVLAAGKKNVEYEQSGKILPSLDPVESESLETPIGPDGDNSEPDLAVAEKTRSMRASNVQTNYGQNATGKFFEEPSW